MRDTIIWQRVEGALIFAGCVTLWWHVPDAAPVWGIVLLFFAPDLSFAAYGAGPRVGAFFYNSLHSYGTAAVLLVPGIVLDASWAQVVGATWLGHAGFDRMLGYGLKSGGGFQLTHLGRIGAAKEGAEP
ncbi:hypothetical protein TRM7557_01687 [Tritonibacter multivorans]|uniref:DUF4260 family protein n=1 Tax=Tritonibacter multivorans TaxID=928856 RepID=A0A0P1GR38_9RHOB|nr:DUF4260 domain-containing protein [Tritonibacter multivorans]MDA7421726.1 DUF4260 domain-containing protein [Tritonibacter multivorans]CUH78020.1 hypothetical protein TRM7557_01687 [Tritonibacter multivorans]SFD03947.1 protein of unknown function [Tritonibacter multivorans]